MSNDPRQAMARVTPFADTTDPATLDVANRLYSAGIDILGRALEPRALDVAMRELLGALGFDVPLFLKTVKTRIIEGRLHAKGAAPLAPQIAAEARVTFQQIETWASGVTRAWERAAFAVTADVETVAAARLERAIAAGGRALAALQEAALTTMDATSQMALSRLATEASMRDSAGDMTGSALRSFADSLRPVDVRAAYELLDRVADMRSRTNSMLGLVLKTGPSAQPPEAIGALSGIGPGGTAPPEAA